MAKAPEEDPESSHGTAYSGQTCCSLEHDGRRHGAGRPSSRSLQTSAYHLKKSRRKTRDACKFQKSRSVHSGL
eukprot:198789-Prymnesium_polylepis.2